MLSVSSLDASNDIHTLPERRIILGCGGLCLDHLAVVPSFPKPDEKIRAQRWTVQGGGNAGNTMTAAARLGLAPRLISKIADDAHGRALLEELTDDGVDTAYIVRNPKGELLKKLMDHLDLSAHDVIKNGVFLMDSENVSVVGNSPFTYVIVDDHMKTRTCISIPGQPAVTVDDFSETSLMKALEGVHIVYSDARLYEIAYLILKEAQRRNIPVLIDAEKKREGLDDLLNFATYITCSAKFPQAWSGASSFGGALVSMLQMLPNVKFVIATCGEEGCVMLERGLCDDLEDEGADVDKLLSSLKKDIDVANSRRPLCVSAKSVMKLVADDAWTVSGRLHVCSAEKIPSTEIVDTTGAGDAFVGGILYALSANMSAEIMLPFASQVAAAVCRMLGARVGLPYYKNPHLAPYLH